MTVTLWWPLLLPTTPVSGLDCGAVTSALRRETQETPADLASRVPVSRRRGQATARLPVCLWTHCRLKTNQCEVDLELNSNYPGAPHLPPVLKVSRSKF